MITDQEVEMFTEYVLSKIKTGASQYTNPLEVRSCVSRLINLVFFTFCNGIYNKDYMNPLISAFVLLILKGILGWDYITTESHVGKIDHGLPWILADFIQDNTSSIC